MFSDRQHDFAAEFAERYAVVQSEQKVVPVQPQLISARFPRSMPKYFETFTLRAIQNLICLAS